MSLDASYLLGLVLEVERQARQGSDGGDRHVGAPAHRLRVEHDDQGLVDGGEVDQQRGESGQRSEVGLTSISTLVPCGVLQQRSTSKADEKMSPRRQRTQAALQEQEARERTSGPASFAFSAPTHSFLAPGA